MRIEGVRYDQTFWEDVKEGEELPAVTLDVPYGRVIMNVAATRDFFAGHNNPFYAQSQGQKTIYVSTMFLQAFVDRVVTDWAGPRAFIRRRRLQIRGSVFAGDAITGTATVARRYEEDAPWPFRHLADVEVSVRNQDGDLCCSATVTVAVPARVAGEG